MKTVRAKFTVSHITKHASGDMNIHMYPVHSGSEENKAFNDYTPSGNLEMYISPKKEAQNFFEPGKEYYLDFIQVDPKS